MATRALRLTQRLPSLPTFTRSTIRLSSTTARDKDRVATNDPVPKADTPNVSSTNATPVTKQGIESGYMVEKPEAGEKQRQMQAPNRKEVWSRSQTPRDRAMSGPSLNLKLPSTSFTNNQYDGQTKE
ncbi:MAG: hypothetical protein MMC23_007145 [Stictis urceolatum]|nr:hypothetical protein [Stictis urceolata]